MEENLFLKSGPSLTIPDVEDVERRINFKFPKDVIELFVRFNGGIPMRCYWLLDDGCFLWLKKFLSIKFSVGTERTLEQSYLLMLDKGVLPVGLVPIAIDHGGNYFCVDGSSTVYYFAVDAWDDSLTKQQNHAKATRLLCTNIIEFINGLVADIEQQPENPV